MIVSCNDDENAVKITRDPEYLDKKIRLKWEKILK